jgi:hypothetical protein
LAQQKKKNARALVKAGAEEKARGKIPLVSRNGWRGEDSRQASMPNQSGRNLYPKAMIEQQAFLGS